MIDAKSVGAHEHREAAIAVCLTHRHRGLALLVRSYRVIKAPLGPVGVVGGYDGDEGGLPDTPRFAACGSSYSETPKNKNGGHHG